MRYKDIMTDELSTSILLKNNHILTDFEDGYYDKRIFESECKYLGKKNIENVLGNNYKLVNIGNSINSENKAENATVVIERNKLYTAEIAVTEILTKMTKQYHNNSKKFDIKKVTSLIIPEGYDAIESNFAQKLYDLLKDDNNTQIDYVKFPSTMKVIGKNAFYSKDKTVEKKGLGGRIFKREFSKNNFSNLKKISGGNNLEIIGDNSFDFSTKSQIDASEFIIGKKIKFLGSSALQNKNIINLNIEPLEKIEEIGENSFKNLDVEKISTGKNLKHLHLKAFKDSKFNTINMTQSKKLQSIKQETFSNIASEIINLPSSIIKFEDSAICDAKNIEYITFGKNKHSGNVEFFGNSFLANCPKLKVAPSFKNAGHIGKNALNQSNNLINANIFYAVLESVSKKMVFDGKDLKSFLINYLESLKSKNVSNTNKIINKRNTQIEDITNNKNRKIEDVLSNCNNGLVDINEILKDDELLGESFVEQLKLLKTLLEKQMASIVKIQNEKAEKLIELETETADEIIGKSDMEFYSIDEKIDKLEIC